MGNGFYSKIRGVSFGNAQSYIEDLHVGQELRVVREPDNPYDSNAVALYDGSRKLGHLAKEIASTISPNINNGVDYRVTVSAITGDYGRRGVNIYIEELKKNDYAKWVNEEKDIEQMNSGQEEDNQGICLNADKGIKQDKDANQADKQEKWENFVNWFRRGDVKHDDGELNGQYYLKTISALKDGQEINILYLTSADGAILDIRILGIVSFYDASSNIELYSLVNEFNKSYRFAKLYIDNDEVAMVQSVYIEDDFNPEKIIMITLNMVQDLEAIYPELMRLRWK